LLAWTNIPETSDPEAAQTAQNIEEDRIGSINDIAGRLHEHCRINGSRLRDPALARLPAHWPFRGSADIEERSRAFPRPGACALPYADHPWSAIERG